MLCAFLVFSMCTTYPVYFIILNFISLYRPTFSHPAVTYFLLSQNILCSVTGCHIEISFRCDFKYPLTLTFIYYIYKPIITNILHLIFQMIIEWKINWAICAIIMYWYLKPGQIINLINGEIRFILTLPNTAAKAYRMYPGISEVTWHFEKIWERRKIIQKV